MPRFWWVNHKQTVRQEVDGGYLWSPKKEAKARSQFYDNMREASPGDAVVSYANAQVGFIGIVSDYAISAPKPEEFGAADSYGYWSAEGWWLPVTWQRVSPVRPKLFLSEIAGLLPEKYSPINASTGDGNQKAYLAEISAPLFGVIANKVGYPMQHIQPLLSTRPKFIDILESTAQKEIEHDRTLSQTEKEQVIKARRGQGDFRNNLFEVEQRCRITGIDNSFLLVASHIKPWRACITAAERLDGFNGLLLAPHVDYLFDRGFLGFADDGSVLVSPRISYGDLVKLGIAESCRRPSGPFRTEQKVYLTYHRDEVFLK